MAMSNPTLARLGILAGCYFSYRQAVTLLRRCSFRGATVVITGGSRGLGLVMARMFGDEGARIAICSRHERDVDRAAHELRGRGSQVLAQPCDLTDEADRESFFRAVRRELGPVDVLVNNAGVIQVGPLETQTGEDFEQSLATHFWAARGAIEHVLPEMRKRRGGRIVNISSIGGEIAVPHLLPYSVGKFALGGYSEGLNAELRRYGIYVTTVYPGLMRTGSPRNALFKGQHRAEYAWFSISDALPLVSMSAETAARRILNACRDGRAAVTLSVPAKAAVVARTLAPELFADLAALAARLLPAPGGVGKRTVEGKDSASAWSPSLLTLLNERAAILNNETN